jgi:hypothetical protein
VHKSLSTNSIPFRHFILFIVPKSSPQTLNDVKRRWGEVKVPKKILSRS